MAPVLIVIVIAVVAVVALVWWLSRRNRHADGVDSFRRQIDALSPEARRGVKEQLHKDDQQPPPPGGADG